MIKVRIEGLFYYLGVGALLASGAVPVFRYGSSIAILLQLFIALLCFLYFRRNFLHNISVRYLALFVLLVVVNALFHFPFVDNKLFGSVVEIFAAFFIITQLDFVKFKKAWLQLVFLVAGFSIIMYLLVLSNFVSVSTIFTRDGQPYLMAYGNVYGWNVLTGRLSGIYHEPGAFQIYLNFTILLFSQEIRSLSLSRSEYFKLGIVCIALFLTQSTMGYVVFGVLVVFLLSRSRLTQKYKALTVPLLVVFIVLFGALLSRSETVVSKFEAIDDPRASIVVRASDNFAMLKMIKEAPLIGHGVGSYSFEAMSTEYGNVTSSNGWLAFSAGFGLPWFLLFVFGSYAAIRRMKLGVPTIFALLILLLLHANENYTHFASAYVFIFHFNKYQ